MLLLTIFNSSDVIFNYASFKLNAVANSVEFAYCWIIYKDSHEFVRYLALFVQPPYSIYGLWSD